MEYALILLVYFAIDAVVGAAFLWVGMKITARFYGMLPGAIYCSYRELLIAIAAAAAASLLPYVGWLAAVIVLFYLLRKFTSAGAGELIMMVVVSRLAAFLFFSFILV
ncbi:MAG: hypothetical protein DRR42_07170 [Gammaproteobacteria bacterium]|nr:MAG: hypothetical protein DRR42_07170 [Gammaproteobacteria bacterium]